MEDSLSTTSASLRKASSVIDLPDPSVFELEAYAQNYSGRSLIQRLLFIARSCPSLSLEAYSLAAKSIKATTLDVSLYRNVVNEYNAIAAGRQKAPALAIDEAWVEATRRTASRESDKLEVELKNYQNNLIKESIRMGHRDLGNFHHRAGDLQAAVRSHSKSRDFCTASTHIVDMCLVVIELALEMQNYAFVRNYVVKAEAALEGMSATASLGQTLASSSGPAKPRPVVLPGMVTTGPSKQEEANTREKVLTAERLHVASGVADLGQGAFSRAAQNFLRITSEARSEDAHHFISPGDIALFAVLCGLATFDRQKIKTRLIENPDLRPLLELEPHLKDLLYHFYESRYKAVLDLLAKYHPRHALDIHLSPHLGAILQRIRSRAIIQYFQPFNSVSLGKMSDAFGWSQDRMLAEILTLVDSDQLKARIDSQNKIIKAYNPSQRVALFQEAVETGTKTEAATRALLLRTKLIQHDLIVKEKAPVRQRQKDEGMEQDEEVINGD